MHLPQPRISRLKAKGDKVTIEIMRKKSRFVYHINPEDPRNIDRRENKFGERWYFYARRDTVSEARQMLLDLEREAKEVSK